MVTIKKLQGRIPISNIVDRIDKNYKGKVIVFPYNHQKTITENPEQYALPCGLSITHQGGPEKLIKIENMIKKPNILSVNNEERDTNT